MNGLRGRASRRWSRRTKSMQAFPRRTKRREAAERAFVGWLYLNDFRS